MKKKLHIENVNTGAKIFDSRSYGALKNLVFAGEGLVKRNGHKTVTEIRDKNGNPLRINGIFEYTYLKNGEAVECKIVHAGAHIFELDREFNYVREVKAESGITIKDKRSRGFLRNGKLYIIGAGDILIFDGETVKSAYFLDGTFVPTTATGITDRKNGMKCQAHQSPNILNPRRKNKLFGGNTFKVHGEENVFVLDGEIAYKKPLTIDVKIRTKASTDPDNDYTTSYIGINSAGEEVSTVVNLRYVKESVDDTVRFFLTEPIRNDRGEEIKIKIGDKIHTFDTLPFGVRLKNHRELCFGFEICAPYPSEENIVIEYESSENYRSLLYDVELGALATHAGGEELLAFTRGGNELYYSDPAEGFAYLPRDNRIMLGGQDKITAVLQLWDNLVGVFKENGFYRISFAKDFCEVISSADSLGALSAYSVSICGSDCLVLNGQGVFGVDDYKSSVREVCLLSPRSLDIDKALSGYTLEEKREACSLVHNGKYYLFIGNNCYVGVTGSGSKKEYSWYPWYGFGARVACTLGGELYFGTQSGEIRKMHSGYSDITLREYSTSTLSLIVDNEGEKTRLITDKTSLEDNTVIRVGAHRLYIGKARKSNGATIFYDGSPTYPGGSVKLFYGDTLILENGTEKTEKTVLGVLGNRVLFEGEDTVYLDVDEGVDTESADEYSVYLKKDSGVYEAEWENGAIYLKSCGEAVKIDGLSSVILETRVKISCEYKTPPLPIGTHLKNATVTRLYLNVYSGTAGEIEAEISTRSSSYSKKITTAQPLDFEALDFNRLDMTYGLDAHIAIPFFVRGFDYLDVKITSNDEKPVYIGFLMIEYYVS